MTASTDITLLYLIKQVELAVRSHLEEILEPYSLTPVQYTALTVLERHPGMTSAELARNSFVRAQTMAQMVTALEALDMIRRDRDPESRRQYLMSLTEHGRQTLVQLREPVADVEHRMVVGLTEGEAHQLRAALRACRVALGGSNPH